jgi:hypothetical protein
MCLPSICMSVQTVEVCVHVEMQLQLIYDLNTANTRFTILCKSPYTQGLHSELKSSGFKFTQYTVQKKSEIIVLEKIKLNTKNFFVSFWVFCV